MYMIREEKKKKKQKTQAHSLIEVVLSNFIILHLFLVFKSMYYYTDICFGI